MQMFIDTETRQIREHWSKDDDLKGWRVVQREKLEAISFAMAGCLAVMYSSELARKEMLDYLIPTILDAANKAYINE